MFIKNQKAFTLVELIVVIAILAILGTVGYISLLGFQMSARDSIRLADITNIAKSLELSELQNGEYPAVTNPVNITFSGATIWQQGSFGEDSFIATRRLSELPKDPLTGSEYVYAKTNTTSEYQLGGILERSLDNSFIPNLTSSYAAASLPGFNATFIRGNYNGKFITHKESPQVYVLGVPSILSKEITDTDISTVISNNSFLFHNKKTLPSTYSGTVDDSDTGWVFIPVTTSGATTTGNPAVIYQGTDSDLSSGNGKLNLITSLQLYYSNSIDIQNTEYYKELRDLDPVVSPNSAIQTINTYITTNLGGLGNTSISITELAQGEAESGEGDSGGGGGGETPVAGATDINSFVSIWKTDNSGQGNNNQIQLPLHDSGTFNFTVDWGDGTADTITSWNQAEKVHTYASAGTYQVVIDGQIDGFSYDDEGTNNRKMIEIEQWGSLDLANTGQQFAYTTFTVSATDSADFSSVTNASQMFYYSGLSGEFANINLSSVTNANQMFSRATINADFTNFILTSLTDGTEMFASGDYDGYGPVINGDLSGLDLSNITNASRMFRWAQVNIDLGTQGPNLSGVTNGVQMFYGVTLDEPITNFDMSSLTNANQMFYRGTISGAITNWDMTSLTSANEMFAGGDYDSYGPNINSSLSGINIPLVTDGTRMFRNAKININLVTDGLDLSNITNGDGMFSAVNLTTPWNGLDLSSVTNANNMFYYATIDEDITNLDLSSATSVDNMFTRGTIDGILSNWILTSLMDGREMFASGDYDNYGPTLNTSLAGLDLSNITNGTAMFRDANINIDMVTQGPDLSGVTNASRMFEGINMTASWDGLDLSSVQTADGMFYYATIDEDITNLDLSSATSVDNMFTRGTIDGILSNWILTSLTDGTEMFASGDYDNYGAIINSSLAGLDFSGVTNMTRMFRDANIDQDISGWNSFIVGVTNCSGFDEGTPVSWIAGEKPTFVSCTP